MQSWVWVRFRSAAEGDEVRVQVPADGVVEDVLRAALDVLELPREGLRINSLRAYHSGDGSRLRNSMSHAEALTTRDIVILEAQDPSRPVTIGVHAATDVAVEPTIAQPIVANAGGSKVSVARHSAAALRRLMKELRLAQLEPSWGVAAAPVSEEDLFTWHCNVAGQPPQGGAPVVLHLELTFPEDYPMRPPKVEVLGSMVHHPNVFSTFICLDMLEGGEWAADEEKRRPYCGWSSAYSILAILRQLQTFFFEGDGTQWWACTLCTLYNPIKNKRCEACDHARGRTKHIAIEVSHNPDFRCRCGHTHEGYMHPSFPDPKNCDDAPSSAPPDCCPEDVCVICLGNLKDVAEAGPLRGAPCARPLVRLENSEGQAVCGHEFHLPCARELLTKQCPLCRAPFEHLAELERAVAPSLPGSAAVLALPSALVCAARVHMARLAGWPLGVVVRLMSFVRRQERAALVGAVPAWRDAARSPLFWEAQELQCFHEKIGPEEDVIGFGVQAEGRGKLSKLTAHFDAVSMTAWRGGLRRAAWKEPMTHWLPLFISRAHATKAAPFLHEALALLSLWSPSGAESHLPLTFFRSLVENGAPEAAVSAAAVLPELMHQLLKQVLDGDRHASLKLLKGYFVLHRLFLHICDEWPAIREAADTALRVFADFEENRTKDATPWLAYMLQLLTIANIGWDDVRVPFTEEVLARSVQFTRASFPNYCPVDPDAEEVPAASESKDLFGEWELSEEEHGSEKSPGFEGASELQDGVWRGRVRGWCSLLGKPRCSGGQHAFALRVRRLPRDAVLRIGWATGSGGGPFQGWCYYASPGCFGGRGWKADHYSWEPYGESFSEGDVLTACVDRGVVSFRRNGAQLGVAFRTSDSAEYRPLVALRRAAEVELLVEPAEGTAELFVNAEGLRDMAWSARLTRRGNTLVMFQVFFLSLVRPQGAGAKPDWETLKSEYDRRFGFPCPRMSAALMEQFAEVHRVVSLHGSDGWTMFFRMLGFSNISSVAIDRMLFAAYKRAKRLNYKMGGRHDHA